MTYLEPTENAGRDFIMRGLKGPVIMLNMLQFRKVADYSQHPQLAPESEISGEQAYRLYMRHTEPFLTASGGEVIFYGEGGAYLIGPENEHWHAVMLVKQQSVEAFMEFATNKDYLSGMGHRSAALADSRLLPLVPTNFAGEY
ncbi:MAG: DUF1330 domain-containing protein [bacterium]